MATTHYVVPNETQYVAPSETHYVVPDEKLQYTGEHVEDFSNSHGSQDISDHDEFEFTEKERKKIMRKVDWRLVPICGVMYCISLLDRTNLSAANIAGMSKELHLVTKTVDRYVCCNFD